MKTSTEKVRAIRERLGTAHTQEKFGQLCGLTRLEVQALESGKNQGTSYAVRASLAKGLSVPVEAMAAFLDDEISLDDLFSLRGFDRSTSWWREALRLRERTEPISTKRLTPPPEPPRALPPETPLLPPSQVDGEHPVKPRKKRTG